MKEKLDRLLKLELNELDKLDLEKELSNLKLTSHRIYQEYLPKTNALKPLAFSYGDTRRNAFRRANME